MSAAQGSEVCTRAAPALAVIADGATGQTGRPGVASLFRAAILALTPTEVRSFLDSHAGRLLANDISFIEGGPTSAEAIEALIKRDWAIRAGR
jgi:hypothetical protein